MTSDLFLACPRRAAWIVRADYPKPVLLIQFLKRCDFTGLKEHLLVSNLR